MGIDTTSLKIAGRKYSYLHVADLSGKIDLVHQIMENEEAESVMPHLCCLREHGYSPAVVVTDLAPELLRAVKKVFPEAVVQGCLFHLKQLLDKKLPTTRFSQKNSNGKAPEVRLWMIVKNMIMNIAFSNSEERENLLAKLSSMQLDGKARKVFEDFLNNLRYYHPPQEMLLIYGCQPRMLYNNYCERRIRDVKGLARKMGGFKKLGTAQKYIDAMFAKFSEKDSETYKFEGSIEKSKTMLELTLEMFATDIIDLNEVAKLINVEASDLKTELEKLGFIVAGDWAFSRSFMEAARQTLMECKPENPLDASKIFELSVDVTIELIRKIGLRILYRTLHPKDVKIEYVVTNGTGG